MQDTHASWSNGGYYFDFIEGVNNMNEEWFGICRLGYPMTMVCFEAIPRAAYYVMGQIFAIDPYNSLPNSLMPIWVYRQSFLGYVRYRVRGCRQIRKKAASIRLTEAAYKVIWFSMVNLLI